MLLNDVTHEMSFRIGAAKMADDVTTKDLDIFLKALGARGFGRPQKLRCAEMIEAALLSAGSLPRPAGKRLADVIRQQAHHLSMNVGLVIDVPDFDAVPVNRV